MLGYAKKQCCSIILGVIFMLGASSTEIVTPLFIGAVIDRFEKDDIDGVHRLCGYFVILIIVSKIVSRILWLKIIIIQVTWL